MNLIKTEIDGLFILEPAIFGDNRGWFYESYSKRTLEEIGNIYGVTKECIRQTELRALKNMRNNKLLSCYAD